MARRNPVIKKGRMIEHAVGGSPVVQVIPSTLPPRGMGEKMFGTTGEKLSGMRDDVRVNAKWNAEGRVVAIIDGIDPSDGIRKRWEWLMLDAPNYVAFLRELGERLVNPSFWAHDDIAPYFPCRPRSRDQIRLAARAMTD